MNSFFNNDIVLCNIEYIDNNHYNLQDIPCFIQKVSNNIFFEVYAPIFVPEITIIIKDSLFSKNCFTCNMFELRYNSVIYSYV